MATQITQGVVAFIRNHDFGADALHIRAEIMVGARERAIGRPYTTAGAQDTLNCSIRSCNTWSVLNTAAWDERSCALRAVAFKGKGGAI
ncbi:MAG: hypothetical protein JJE42_11510 [Burkholderiales bacterium]|nr:hypothetical protein [Burkholderiales bacterium]